MHRTAHVPRACRDRTLFRAFLPLQPGPISHLPGRISSREVPRGQGAGRAWAPLPEAPSSLSPVLQGLEEAPCRVWLSSRPSLSWSLFCPTPSWGCCPKRTNRVWGRHILAGSPWRLLPQGCSIHPRSRQQPWLPPPQPAMGPHQPGPTPWTTQSLTVQNSR